MAKKKGQVPESETVIVEKEKGKFFQKLLLWLVIPILFATVVLLVVAKFAGINVVDKAKDLAGSLPFVEQTTDADNSGSSKKDLKILEERVVTLQAEMKEKEAQVFDLQQQLEASAEQNEALLIEQERLIDEAEIAKRDAETKQKQGGELVSTFEKMSAKAAAPVLINMKDAQAIEILSNLKTETLAAILEKMPPEKAAHYTTLMSK